MTRVKRKEEQRGRGAVSGLGRGRVEMERGTVAWEESDVGESAGRGTFPEKLGPSLREGSVMKQ